MKRYLKELYNGETFSYYLFWDGQVAAIAKIKSIKKLSKELTIIPIIDNDIKKSLESLGYSGDGLTVVIFGPKVIDRIENLENSISEIPDWIIENKERLLPDSISEEDIIFDYAVFNNKENSSLAFCVSKKSVVAEVSEYLKENDLLINGVKPLLGFLLECTGQLIHIAGESSIQIPGYQTEYLSSETGLLLTSKKTENDTDILEYELDKVNALNEYNNLYFDKEAQDFLSKIHKWGIRYFKPVFIGFLSIIALTVLLNTILIIEESRESEKLTELQFLKTNLENIESEIEVLEKKHNLQKQLGGFRTKLNSYLSAVSEAKPNELWWRRLEYKSGIEITIEGFCIGEKQPAEYNNNLNKYWDTSELRIAQIIKYRPRDDTRIPSKYHNRIYKFKMNINGV